MFLFDSILILQWISYLLLMVITVSYTILPSSWILDINFVAECMYLVVGTKACTVWHAICCKIAAVASNQQPAAAAATARIVNISVLYCYLRVIILV